MLPASRKRRRRKLVSSSRLSLMVKKARFGQEDLVADRAVCAKTTLNARAKFRSVSVLVGRCLHTARTEVVGLSQLPQKVTMKVPMWRVHRGG